MEFPPRYDIYGKGGKRKGFRFQILSIRTRAVIADLEPEKRGKETIKTFSLFTLKILTFMTKYGS
jgi:hypothetical protein